MVLRGAGGRSSGGGQLQGARFGGREHSRCEDEEGRAESALQRLAAPGSAPLCRTPRRPLECKTHRSALSEGGGRLLQGRLFALSGSIGSVGWIFLPEIRFGKCSGWRSRGPTSSTRSCS